MLPGGVARARLTQHLEAVGTEGMCAVGLAGALTSPFSSFPGLGGRRSTSRDRTTCNYYLGSFSFLKLFSTLSQQSVCAHNTAGSCFGPVLITVTVFFLLSWF